MVWLVSLWAIVLTSGLLYSGRYSYRGVLEGPLYFRQAMLILRVLEKTLFVAVLIVSLVEKYYVVAAVVAVASLVAPGVLKRRAYWAEVRRQAQFQVEANKMEWKAAMDVGKMILDMEIKDAGRPG